MDADRTVAKEDAKRAVAEALLRAEKLAKMKREGRIPPVMGGPKIKTEGIVMPPQASFVRG